MHNRFLQLIVASLLLAGCSTAIKSNPARTATEELLVSAAADRAAKTIAFNLPPDSLVFIDAANFDSPDGKYAVAAVRDNLMQHHERLAEKKEKADFVVELRAGALSTNQKETLVGIPSFNIPVPLASAPATFPELALYKSAEQEGIAHFSAAIYNAKNGKLVQDAAGEPQFGFSHDTKQTAFFFITWTSNDILPADEAVPKIQP